MSENNNDHTNGSNTIDGGDEKALVIPLTDTLSDRIEHLAWENDRSFEDVATACCRYGVIHYEDALSEE